MLIVAAVYVSLKDTLVKVTSVDVTCLLMDVMSLSALRIDR